MTVDIPHIRYRRKDQFRERNLQRWQNYQARLEKENEEHAAKKKSCGLTS